MQQFIVMLDSVDFHHHVVAIIFLHELIVEVFGETNQRQLVR